MMGTQKSLFVPILLLEQKSLHGEMHPIRGVPRSRKVKIPGEYPDKNRKKPGATTQEAYYSPQDLLMVSYRPFRNKPQNITNMGDHYPTSENVENLRTLVPLTAHARTRLTLAMLKDNRVTT